MRRLVGQSSTAYRGMVFQDSDIYKTLEAVAWVLEGPVRVVAASAGEPLYQPVEARQPPRIRTETRMRAIPYARWANRGPRAMRVWLPVALE